MTVFFNVDSVVGSEFEEIFFIMWSILLGLHILRILLLLEYGFQWVLFLVWPRRKSGYNL